MSPPSTSAVPLRLAAIASCAWLLAACGERPSFVPGDECELNTQCAAPLVCRLGHCRVECRDERDCEPGLHCVRDEAGLGVCQLPPETRCARASDCPSHLVCHFGQCANACRADVDCPPGSQCLEGEDGALGCRDASTVGCERNVECVEELGEGYVCAVDQRCRPACRESWDCRDGMVCDTTSEPAVCAWPSAGADGGPIDAGASDASTGADATITTDAGTDVPTPPPARLGAGNYSTCAAPMSGGVRCWGRNTLGLLGVGDTTDRDVPTDVVGLASATAIGVGHSLACAMAGTTLSCWGSNGDGQLGVGSLVPDHRTTPGAVPPPTSWSSLDDVAAGLAHACAIADGALYCWGDNSSGQLGVDDFVDRSSPTSVSLPGVPLRVSAQSSHTCVLLFAGGVACFGDNLELQTGGGARDADVPAPALVAGITDAVDVAAGSTHTCALLRDGTVWCWGAPYNGQLGTMSFPVWMPPTMPVATPAQTLPIDDTVVQITAGSAHTCALTRGGELWCWGDNTFGQTGQDPSSPIVTAPTRVPGLASVAEIAAGSYHTCLRLTTGEHLCFGDDTYGQLGDGSTGGATHVPTPVTWTP